MKDILEEEEGEGQFIAELRQFVARVKGAMDSGEVGRGEGQQLARQIDFQMNVLRSKNQQGRNFRGVAEDLSRLKGRVEQLNLGPGCP